MNEEGAPEEAAYFKTIEERFCALRGSSMLLSPRDWSLMADWWSSGIPLPVILESLEEVFSAHARRGADSERINSLAYARPEILRRARLHREMTSPRRSESEESARLREEIRRHLGRMLGGLKQASARVRDDGRESLARILLEVAAEVRSLRKQAALSGWDPLEAEKTLETLDEELRESALLSLGDSERADLRKEVEAVLRAQHQPSPRPEALQEVRGAVQGRLLRRRLGFPHLSLLGGG